jgi:hypothetical protein
MISAWVQNGVPRGQILKSEEPYPVVPHLKAFDKCFPNQQTFGRYDVI